MAHIEKTEWPQCECGLESTHSIGARDNITRYLCCRCYVAEGHPPADWHPSCMVMYFERNKSPIDMMRCICGTEQYGQRTDGRPVHGCDGHGP